MGALGEARLGMRSALAKLLLIGLGISVGTAFVEIALRIVPGLDLRVVTSFQSPPWKAWADPAWGNPGGPAYRTEPTLVYEHGPAVDMAVPAAEHPRGTFRFRTNNLGLRRNANTAATKSPDILRILVLGDSHTDGYVDNDESFCALLESSLARRLPPGRRVEVLNAGIAGYSPIRPPAAPSRHARETRPGLSQVREDSLQPALSMRSRCSPCCATQSSSDR